MSELCRCGCGLPAPIAKTTRRSDRVVRGQLLPYRQGHNMRKGAYSGSHYAARYRPDHPRGPYVYEHVLVAEAALGRALPDGAVVHHVNGDRRDNRPANLVICQDVQYHNLLHKRARIISAGGNPNTHRICCTCKQLVAIVLMRRMKPSVRRESSQCAACSTKALDCLAAARRDGPLRYREIGQ